MHGKVSYLLSLNKEDKYKSEGAPAFLKLLLRENLRIRKKMLVKEVEYGIGQIITRITVITLHGA